MENTQDTESSDNVINGYCFCEQVKFQIPLEYSPDDIEVAAYCHCDSCRRSHAAPLYQVVYIKSKLVNFTQGAESIKLFSKGEPTSTKRFFCGNCGTRLYNIAPGVDKRGGDSYFGMFPNTFEPKYSKQLPLILQPTKIAHGDEIVMNMENFKQHHDQL